MADDLRLIESDDEATIVAQLKEELSHAADNGYDFADWTSHEIALDIMAYSATFEDWQDANALAGFIMKARS